MSNIDKINEIDLELIIQALAIRYKRNWPTLFLYDKWKVSDGWRASLNKGIVSDFTPPNTRPAWDRINFVSSYLWLSKWEAISWLEDKFNIKKNEKFMRETTNVIKDKWDSLGEELTEEQISFLEGRQIYPDKLKGILKNYKGNISSPICTENWRIISIQSRAITDKGSRYYVESNTDSDWIFVSWIDNSKKALIVVEGLTDFWSLRQYTTNVVGLINAKNDKQIDMIKALSQSYEIYFIPDNDEAWKTTIDKFIEKWIKHNLFSLEAYWVKDINELLCWFLPWDEILDIIFQEAERPPSSIQLALEKAKWYKKLYDENDWKLWFPSWYDKLDINTWGFIKGKVYMIMAYSNVGKTRFAYSLLRNMIKLKKKIHFYSLEVDTWMLLVEILSALSGQTKEEVLYDLDNQDISDLDKYVEIYDTKRKLDDIESHIRNSKPDVAFIDFLQNIEQQWSEYEKMTEIALRIQKLAIISWTTIVSLSQVANESRFLTWEQIMPKGSGALFASSDVIFSLWAQDWQKYITISKNKYWPANKTFVVEIDYSKCVFNMADLLDWELSPKKTQFKWLK